MSRLHPIALQPGMRLRSPVCTTEGMVVQAPATPIAVPCGGAPLAREAARPLPSSG